MAENTFELQMAQRIRNLENRIEALSIKQYGYTLADVLDMIAGFPELRGFWPFSSIIEGGHAVDYSFQGRALTNVGGAGRFYWNTGIPYGKSNGSTLYWRRNDEAGLDIAGAMTMGMWIYFASATAGQSPNFMSKFGAPGVNSRSYVLWYDYASGSKKVNFVVSTDGNTGVSVTTVSPLNLASWYFVMARFTPSTELAIWLNDEKTINTTGIPATLFNSASNFMLGIRSDLTAGGGDFAMSMPFICASALSDDLINRYWRVSRCFFGI